MEITTRAAVAADLERINEIYNTTIVDSHVSFDTEPWTGGQREAWFAAREGHPLHQVWVAEVEGVVVGTAYAGPWRDKAAYADAVETTIVLEPGVTGQGVGTALYTALLNALANAGAHRAYVIVALPNDASIAMHHRLGFRTIGVLDEVGEKMGTRWSTELLEKHLQ